MPYRKGRATRHLSRWTAVGYSRTCWRDVHVGHLNFTEAMIEMQGKPLSTAQPLAEVDLQPQCEHTDGDAQPGLCVEYGRALRPRAPG